MVLQFAERGKLLGRLMEKIPFWIYGVRMIIQFDNYPNSFPKTRKFFRKKNRKKNLQAENKKILDFRQQLVRCMPECSKIWRSSALFALGFSIGSISSIGPRNCEYRQFLCIAPIWPRNGEYRGFFLVLTSVGYFFALVSSRLAYIPLHNVIDAGRLFRLRVK